MSSDGRTLALTLVLLTHVASRSGSAQPADDNRMHTRRMTVTVTPDAGSATVPSHTDTEVQFVIDSQGLTGSVNYGITIEQCAGSGLASGSTCTPVPTGVTLNQNTTSALVKIRFRSSGSGTIAIEIRATAEFNLFDTDQGSQLVTVVTPR